MAETKASTQDKETYEDMEGKQTFGKIQVRKKFLKKARALQPVLLDPLNVQTGVAASIIMNLIEGRNLLFRKGRARKEINWQRYVWVHFQCF